MSSSNTQATGIRNDLSDGGNRMANYIRSLPLATRFYFFLCVGVFIFECFNQVTIMGTCFLPSSLFTHYNKLYTLITSAFVHTDAFHLLFNMLSFLSLATALESKRFGSLLFFYLILLFSLLVSIMLYAVTFLISYPPLNNPSSMNSCVVGLSGVIFALLQILCFGNAHSTSLFGFLKMPLKLYPWFSLLLTSFVLQNVSFSGHLSGIFVGTLYEYGILDVLIPSHAFLVKVELSPSFGSILSTVGYITNPQYGTTSSFHNTTTTNVSVSTITSWYQRARDRVFGSGGNVGGSADNSSRFTGLGQGRVLGSTSPGVITPNMSSEPTPPIVSPMVGQLSNHSPHSPQTL
ncbi:hypothetical protein SAMD00019534_017970 [Acytostelium subglobosum LB1]|uniref:hypothetical protein n=1 Tax=Acytostelium subglobosum LB1 TaxID=1410327 RepID=UPI00064506B0|nr:hypothetical protein SAMD00019534_017970 [Acytostelium subglobosum LB1]GAM18622.1 hypothetical protein SAMD00019534_017970 [Acytostelium subglobosum LB1]|eukprot:XP_012757842.1 hypothetical protein SAMD00019534_017970 [Acytostelium subglobosum LB1]